MAVYVIVILGAILLLVAAYRTLGGATSRPLEPAALLRGLQGDIGESLDELTRCLDGVPVDTTRDDDGRASRRRTAAIQQTLDTLPADAELDDRQVAARTLLAAAAEDLSWAWRMLPLNPGTDGLTEAVRLLRGHAARSLAEAALLLPAAPVGEPADRV
jgi:hypothetical protein